MTSAVTVFSLDRNLDTEYVNEPLTLRFNPAKEEMECYLNETVIGTVANTATTSLAKTLTRAKLQQAYPGVTEFSAVADRTGTVTIKGTRRRVLHVMVHPPMNQEGVAPTATSAEQPVTIQQTFNFVSTAPSQVIEEMRAKFNARESIFLEMDKEDRVRFNGSSILAVAETPNKVFNAILEKQTTPSCELVALSKEKLVASINTTAEEVEHHARRFVYDGEVERVVNEGLFTLEEIEERILFASDCGVPEKHITQILREMRPYAEEVAVRIPKKPKTPFQDYDNHVKTCVVYLNTKRHLILDGPAAVGKNTLIETISWLYGRPMYELSVNRQTDAHDMLGDKTLTVKTEAPQLYQPTAQMDQHDRLLTMMTNLVNVQLSAASGGQRVEFDRGLLVEAMEVGGIFCFDELNTSSSSIMSLVNSLLDHRGAINVPGYGFVKAHPDFRALATMNAGYFGTAELNQALSSRFTHRLFDYPDSIEAILKINVPQAKATHIREVNTLYKQLTASVRSTQAPLPETCINVRGFITSLMVAEDLGLQAALIDNIANGIKMKPQREAVKAAIRLAVRA